MKSKKPEVHYSGFAGHHLHRGYVSIGHVRDGSKQWRPDAWDITRITRITRTTRIGGITCVTRTWHHADAIAALTNRVFDQHVRCETWAGPRLS